MRILVVGGTFDNDGGRKSGFITKYADAIRIWSPADDSVTCINGGHYDILKPLLDTAADYHAVFWFANVPNDFEKVRDVKAVAPKVMLISSKRNDGGKYTFEELLQRALAVKANLCYEFSVRTGGIIHIRVFDPLGCIWYDGENIDDAVKKTLERLRSLLLVTRQKTECVVGEEREIAVRACSDTDCADFRSFLEKETAFIDVVHQFAEVMQDIMPLPPDAVRFLGNASMRREVIHPWRCSKGMPSFRAGENLVFVSRRNVPKQFITAEDFVPVFLDSENQKLWYWGNNKPSVDTPVQTRLYRSLPNIRYMIHSHCYIRSAPYTAIALPCGAVEEADVVLGLIKKERNASDMCFHDSFYAINLTGHGSIVMADDPTKILACKEMLMARQTPEVM